MNSFKSCFDFFSVCGPSLGVSEVVVHLINQDSPLPGSLTPSTAFSLGPNGGPLLLESWR